MDVLNVNRPRCDFKRFPKAHEVKDLIVQLVGSSYNWKIERNAGRILCSGVDYDFLSKFEVIEMSLNFKL